MIRPEVCSSLGHPIIGLATFEQRVEFEALQQQKTCIHFNGVQNATCKVGMTYPCRCLLPCFAESYAPERCPLRHLPEEGEALCRARERVIQIDMALEQLRHRKQAKQCLDCGGAYARLRQAGRGVYAEPCGHWQWQGRIPTEET